MFQNLLTSSRVVLTSFLKARVRELVLVKNMKERVEKVICDNEEHLFGTGL